LEDRNVTGEPRSSILNKSYDANFKEYLAQMREAINNDEKIITENKGYFPDILNTGATEALHSENNKLVIPTDQIKDIKIAVKI
jgi:hypothetical protein